MTTEIADTTDTPAHRPLERYVQLETDHFCDCGYNLHGQVVTRDERLGFMVCRCPECARWHPAGQGVSARRVWLGRLAAGMLMGWVLGLVGFFLGMGFLLATWQTVAVMEGTTMGYYLPDGRQVINSTTRRRERTSGRSRGPIRWSHGRVRGNTGASNCHLPITGSEITKR